MNLRGVKENEERRQNRLLTWFRRLHDGQINGSTCARTDRTHIKSESDSVLSCTQRPRLKNKGWVQNKWTKLKQSKHICQILMVAWLLLYWTHIANSCLSERNSFSIFFTWMVGSKCSFKAGSIATHIIRVANLSMRIKQTRNKGHILLMLKADRSSQNYSVYFLHTFVGK